MTRWRPTRELKLIRKCQARASFDRCPPRYQQRLTHLNAVVAQRIAETDLRLDRKSEILCARFTEFVERVGGLPRNVKEIKISETMRMETYAFVEAVGLWDPPNIIIKRTQLKRIEEYAGTLLHEIAHARSGAPDISSEFEQSLTELLGHTGSRIDGVEVKSTILSKLFGS